MLKAEGPCVIFGPKISGYQLCSVGLGIGAVPRSVEEPPVAPSLRVRKHD